MNPIRNPARERLEKGEVALGAGLRQARSVEIAKIMKSAGYDYLFIDLEHGAMSLDTAVQISVAALDVGIAPIVRVPEMQFALASRALDGGALGIVMPHVDDAAAAAEAVDRLKYPPAGHRSVAGVSALFDFQRVDPGEATRAINDANLLTVMLETPEAIAKADAIAAVEGVDVLLIGTGDLTASLGIMGQAEHASIVAAYESVIAACRRHGKWAGMGGIGQIEVMARYIAMGVQFVLAGNDIGMMMAGGTQISAALREGG